MWRKVLVEEKGSVMVMVVIGLIVLIGFTGLVIDGGQAYMTKSRLQNAADAAALAGAQSLPTAGTAANAAITYAGRNGMKPLVSDINSSGNTYTAFRAADRVVAQILPASQGETITQPKYTEEDLEKLEDELREHLNAISNPELMALANSYSITYETTQETIGYTFAELDGMTSTALIAMADQYNITDGLTTTIVPGTHTAGEFSGYSNQQLLQKANELFVPEGDGLTTLLIDNMSEPQLRECAADYGITIDGSCLKDGKIKDQKIDDVIRLLKNNLPGHPVISAKIISDKTALINAIVDKLNQKDATTSKTITDKNALINALLAKASSMTVTVPKYREQLCDDIIDIEIADLDDDTETIETGSHPDQIKVTCTRTIDNSFMAILGFPTRTVSATAVAENPGFMGDTMPFINWDSYDVGDEIILWDKEGSGNFECLMHAPHDPYYHFDPAIGAEKKNGKVANIKKELENICIPGAVVYVISLKNDVMVPGNEIPTSKGSFVYPSANTKNKAIISSDYLALLKCTVISYDSKTIGLRIDESYEDLSPSGIETISGRPKLVE